MLTTVEAEVDVDGKVVLLEPLPVTRKRKALVTLLEENGATEREDKGNIKQVLEVLKTARFRTRKSFSAEEIDEQVEEARNSWD